MQIENELVIKKISEIRPYARNPRKNEKTVELLTQIIPKVGFNVPIVIDSKGIIVKGHARYAAAIRLGMKEVPCIVTHADDDAIKADRITDNKIAEFSEWMNDEVLEEIEGINTDIDFSKMGFPVASLDDIQTHEQMANSNEFSGRANKNTTAQKIEPSIKVREKYYKCVCGNCGHVMFVKASAINK